MTQLIEQFMNRESVLGFSPQRWRERAAALLPQIRHWPVEPIGMVRPESDDRAWQGWRMVPEAPETVLRERKWHSGDSFFLDFGETLVGRLQLGFLVPAGYCDSPVRLRLMAGELPYETVIPPDPFESGLSRSWLQDEVINFDVPVSDFTLPRRYSLRYLKVEIVATPRAGLTFSLIRLIAESAAGELPPPLPELPPDLRRIDRVGLRTLRNCMQLCFEDGPKRDRRLWLGDLFLQAKVNAVSFRRFDLVERSIFLLASGVDAEGRVPSCVFEHPHPVGGGYIPDYALLLAPLLLEHGRFSGNWEPAQSLFFLAAHQFELLRGCFDRRGIFQDPGKWWLFVDHQQSLDRQLSIQMIYIYGLRALCELAERCGETESVPAWRREIDRLGVAARQFCYDPAIGVMRSGASGQISYASQIWAILAGVLSLGEGRRALDELIRRPDAVRPVSPYLQHFLLEAYEICRQPEKVQALIRSYWGGMVKYGADTFWEVFDPENPFVSPYGEVRSNSACHAWSCTPSYFLRRNLIGSEAGSVE